MAEKRMNWYINKGQTISSAAPLLFDFYRTFPTTANSTCVTKLIVCDSKRAPAAFDDHEGSSTKVLCRLVTNLANVPSHLYESRTSPQGRGYYQLEYQIGMQLESGGLKFDMRIDDIVYGSVTATFDST